MKLKYGLMVFAIVGEIPFLAATQSSYLTDYVVAMLDNQLNLPVREKVKVSNSKLFFRADRLARGGFVFKKDRQRSGDTRNSNEAFFDVYETAGNRRVARGMIVECEDYRSAKSRLSLLSKRVSAPFEHFAHELRNDECIGDFCITDGDHPVDWVFFVRGNKAIYFYISFFNDIDLLAMARAMDELILENAAACASVKPLSS